MCVGSDGTCEDDWTRERGRERKGWAGENGLCLASWAWPASVFCWVPLLLPGAQLKRGYIEGRRRAPSLPISSTADGSRILSVPAQPFPERAHDGGTAAAGGRL